MHTREPQLLRLAQARLAAGELPPARHGRRSVISEGHGGQCALCGTAILFDEACCELPQAGGLRTLALHRICERVWAAASEDFVPAPGSRANLCYAQLA